MHAKKKTCKSNKFNKFLRPKINTQKSVVLYTPTMNIPKRRLRKEILFLIASRKYLEII